MSDYVEKVNKKTIADLTVHLLKSFKEYAIHHQGKWTNKGEIIIAFHLALKRILTEEESKYGEIEGIL